MPERSPRLPCPVCLGVMMDLVTFGSSQAIEVDRCSRCGGIWFDRGELDRLGTVPEETRAVLTVAAADRPPSLCHQCHAPIDRAAQGCPGCGHENRIHCPRCERSMEMVTRPGLALDVCRPCEGVWFDQAELKAIWGQSFDRALDRRRLTGRDAALATADVGTELLFHSVIVGPDLALPLAAAGVDAISASAGALAQLPEALQATPELAAQVFEAVGEAAGAVFETVVDIISGIF